jgi:aminomethyltransferase
MVSFGGWEMPLEFASGTVAEHMSCRRDVAVFDVSHLGTVRLAGPEARPTLQRALTNDLAKIRPGKAQYTHLLDEDGSVLDDLIVWWTGEDSFDVMPNASNTSRVLAAIGGTDVTAHRAVLAVQGPRSRALMEAVLPEVVSVGHFGVRELAWQGVPVVVAGTGYTGETGVECAVPAAQAVALWEAIVAAGAAPAGLGARDTLRLEAGLPLHGHELGPGITPLEAGLGWVVAWDKPGGFRGRDALVAQRQRGTDRVLRGLIGPGRQPLRAGYRFWREGAAAGELTSGNFSPVLGCGIGMAFLPTDVADGDVVDVEARGRHMACQVVHLPFIQKPARGA